MERLAGRLAEIDREARERHVLDRTLSCRVPDLGVVFFGRLRDGGLHDIRGERHRDPNSASTAARQAQIGFTVGGDDLLALVDGELGFARAWATGRLRVDASLADLLRLRRLL